MKLQTETLEFRTQGQGDLVDITPAVQARLAASGLAEGQATVFVVGSTAAITTFEYEPGLKKDMARLYEALAPAGKEYAHHQTWGDDNGSSHVRAALQGPSLTVPFKEGRLMLGVWQQIVLAEFDTRPRDRQVVVQLPG
ncbi:MAG: secondary thiamine-phosphate synthase enzyme YjbQ [Elusimicrobiota bacterium]